MINLWYNESIKNGPVRGPRKVLESLHESLDQENIPYTVNEDKYQYNFLVHYDALGYSKHEKLEHESCVIGPQIWPFDQYGHFLKDNPNYYKKLICPGESVYLSFQQQGFLKEKLSIWPVGIKDIPDEHEDNEKFLIYYKRRPLHLLEKTKLFLDNKKIKYEILSYGNYNQDEFYSKIKSCSKAIIIDGPETQGIAIQEIMSSNIPLLVWDNLEYFEDGVPEQFKKNPSPTSVHYFSEECGEKFYSYEELDKTFDKFMSTQYNPKKYVMKELSYKSTVKKLLDIFQL